MKTLGTALKLIRQFHRYKQKDLGKKLGISSSHLSEIESGHKPVSIEILEKYSQIFDLSMSSIMIFAEMQNSNPDKLSYKIADKAIKMLDWIAVVGTEVDHK